MSGPFATLAFAALHATLTFADRSEARARNTGVDGLPSAVADFDTSPSARLDVDSHRSKSYVTYAPRFTLRSVNFESSTEVLHRGSVSTTWRASRLTQINVTQDAAYGVQDFSALLIAQPTIAGQPPPVDRVPAGQSIHFADSRSALVIGSTLSRRWRLTFIAEYVLSGGVESLDRAIFPLLRGGRGSVALERVLGAYDGVISTLRGNRYAFDAGGFRPNARNSVVDLLEGWRHRWSRSTETTIGAGASVAFLELPTSGTDVHPLFEATLVHRDAEDRLEAQAVTRMVTYYDRLRGVPDYQSQSTLGFVYAPWTRRFGFSLRAQLGFAQSVPATKTGALRIFLGEVGAQYRANKRILFELGVRGLEESVRDQPDVPFLWAGFFAATFTTERFRL